MAAFDFNPIRNTAIELVKTFGRHQPCSLLRAVEATPGDATKPWRVGAATILEFRFIGVVSTLEFPRRSDPSMDHDIDVIVPGDLQTTGAVTDPLTLCGDPITNIDRLQTGGQQYIILGVQDITPDDKPIIYKLRARAWPLINAQPNSVF